MSDTIAARITIPDGITFADLRLTRDTQTGEIEFDWAPIEAICAASGLDIELLRASEDNRAALLTSWYFEHRAHGGAPDPVQEDLLAEVVAEDARGHGQSYPPGRA